jgi:hypothetical protein
MDAMRRITRTQVELAREQGKLEALKSMGVNEMLERTRQDHDRMQQQPPAPPPAASPQPPVIQVVAPVPVPEPPKPPEPPRSTKDDLTELVDKVNMMKQVAIALGLVPPSVAPNPGPPPAPAPPPSPPPPVVTAPSIASSAVETAAAVAASTMSEDTGPFEVKELGPVRLAYGKDNKAMEWYWQLMANADKIKEVVEGGMSRYTEAKKAGESESVLRSLRDEIGKSVQEQRKIVGQMGQIQQRLQNVERSATAPLPIPEPINIDDLFSRQPAPAPVPPAHPAAAAPPAPAIPAPPDILPDGGDIVAGDVPAEAEPSKKTDGILETLAFADSLLS